MKKSLNIAMRGMIAFLAVAPLLAGCGDKTVTEPGKNDTPVMKEQRQQKDGD